MKKILMVSLALATALATASAAKADTLSFVAIGTSDGDPNATATNYLVNNASGDLTGTAIGADEYGITAASNVSITFAGTTYTAAFVPNTTPWAVDSTSVNGFNFTDIVSTNGTSGDLPSVAGVSGLVFQLTSAGTYDGYYLAFYNDGTSDVVDASNAAGSIYFPTSNGFEEQFEVTPEPSSLLLMGTGLLCMAGFLFRRKALQGTI